MSPFDYIVLALILSIVGAVIALVLLCTKEDYDDAGVHVDDHNSIDLAKIYRDPIGFEPHGARDTFVPTEVDTMSTDEFIESFRQTVEGEVWPGNTRTQRQAMRALAMLIEARGIMDECLDGLPCDIDNEDLVNKVSNWLVRGHQD
jgi:hypothetical protein